MGEAKRKGTREQRQAEAEPKAVITKGYMTMGPNYDDLNGELRGWWVYPDPAPDREPVRIIRGH